MATTLSRPKEKIRVLLLEGIADTAVDAFGAAGYTHVQRSPKALKGEELRAALQGRVDPGHSLTSSRRCR